MLVNVLPPLVLTCHCTLGVGVPLAVAENWPSRRQSPSDWRGWRSRPRCFARRIDNGDRYLGDVRRAVAVQVRAGEFDRVVAAVTVNR